MRYTNRHFTYFLLTYKPVGYEGAATTIIACLVKILHPAQLDHSTKKHSSLTESRQRHPP